MNTKLNTTRRTPRKQHQDPETHHQRINCPTCTTTSAEELLDYVKEAMHASVRESEVLRNLKIPQIGHQEDKSPQIAIVTYSLDSRPQFLHVVLPNETDPNLPTAITSNPKKKNRGISSETLVRNQKHYRLPIH